MSDLGTILDALATLAVGAVTGLTAGNAERGVRLAGRLGPGEFPHLFVHNPEVDTDELPYQQERAASRVSLTLVMRDTTQEAVMVEVEAIRDAIAADPTLSGAVFRCRVARWGVREHPESPFKAGDLLVMTEDET